MSIHAGIFRYRRGSFGEDHDVFNIDKQSPKIKVAFAEESLKLATTIDPEHKPETKNPSGLDTLQAVAERLITEEENSFINGVIPESKVERDQFIAKRKNHYNEYEMLCKWREDKKNGIISDEEEDVDQNA